MSLSYAFRCDICGESVYAPADVVPENIPGEWATLTIKHPNEPERTYKGHVCPNCAKAVESGESLDIYRMRVAVARGEPVIVDLHDGGIADKSELEDNPDGEFCEEVSEEEAVHITTEGTQ